MKRSRVSASVLIAVVGIGSVAMLAGAGPDPATGGVHAPVSTATLTGVLEERVFIQDCRCYPWVIDKGGRVSEVDVSSVQADARALVGQRVRASGRWMTYTRDGRSIRYLKVTRLDPA